MEGDCCDWTGPSDSVPVMEHCCLYKKGQTDEESRTSAAGLRVTLW